jgi:hypothetical protein
MLLPPWLIWWGSRAHGRAGSRAHSGLLPPVPRPADASNTQGRLYPSVERSDARSRHRMPRPASRGGSRTRT